MVQSGIWLDAVGEDFVDQPIIKIEAFWIGRASSVRKDARPCNGEAIGLGAQRLHQLDVFLVPVVVVVGDVTRALIGDLSGRVRKAIPNRWASTVLVDGAFDLIGRSRGAPAKISGKARGGFQSTRRALRVRRCDRSRRQT